MGRLESLTALALGRGHYESLVLQSSDGESSRSTQQYNDRGYPRNPETKRREREHVRAANEVMQVTGVVEDTNAAKLKANQYTQDKNEETFTALRLMEFGRTALIAGTWSVIGLRRRDLLYRPYSQMPLYEILRGEATMYSVSHIFFAGLPSVFAYHISDWTLFFLGQVLDTVLDEDEFDLSTGQMVLKRILMGARDILAFQATLHFRMFAFLQQLNLISTSRFVPGWRSFIPFSTTSPLQLPESPPLNLGGVLVWGSALFRTLSPMMVILGHGKVKQFVAQILYRPIYKSLPRPTGDSMFSGLPFSPPPLEYDSPDRPEQGTTGRSQDEPTLRALEGFPVADRQNSRSRPQDLDADQELSGDEDEEITHATLISFDVEATEAVESSFGTWSAELRSANEPKPSEDIKYNVTGMTLLPPILATEGLRDVVSSIIVLPLEAFMVRVIGRAYRHSAGLGVEDMWSLKHGLPSFGHMFSTFTMQLVVTGVVWVGFTAGTQLWAERNRALRAKRAKNDGNEAALS